MVVTFVFIPELNGLDLKEGDKRWLAIVSVSHMGSCWHAPVADQPAWQRWQRYSRCCRCLTTVPPSFPHPLLPVAACPQGAESEYCGEAINPKHLSFIEKVMGYQKNYDPKAAADNLNGDLQQGSKSKEAFIVTSPTSAAVSANGARGTGPSLQGTSR